MRDAIILSDLHLGSAVCRGEELAQFLDSLLAGERFTDRLILNGDVLDTYDLRRMTAEHWDILDRLRELNRRTEVVWVSGNHDGPPKKLSRLLDIPVRGDYVFESGGYRVLVLHGDRFDDFIAAHPWLTDVADGFYRFLQRVDPSHTLARFAKHRSKTFLRCTEKLADAAKAFAMLRDCDAVCCGHTHFPIADEVGSVRYYNSGCWTEKPCHYLTVGHGDVRLEAFAPEAELVPFPRVSESPSAEPVQAAV